MGLCYNIAFIFLYERIYLEETKINGTFEIIDVNYKDKSFKYVMKTIENKEIKHSKNTKLITYTNTKLNIGDIVRISGNFKKADVSRNYKGFNYRNYLKSKKIYGIVDLEKVEIIDKKIDFDAVLGNISNHLNLKIKSLYGDNEYSNFLNSILLGKTDDLDENIIENFRDVNISHILAISGLHISYIVIGLKFVLNKIIKNVKMQNILLVLMLFFFCALTGFSVSCMRASIMNSLILISFNLNKKNNFYKSFFISFIILILLNPFNIYNVGMWLSFLSTLSIVLFYKLLYRIFEKYLKKVKHRDMYLKILKVVLISVSAQILIFPISIYEFNLISLSFIISNFLVSFIIGPILILGYITLFLSYIKNPFNKFLIYIEKILIDIILKISEVLSKIPFSKFYVKTPYFISIVGFYIFVFVIILLFKKRKYSILKMILSIKYFKKVVRKYYQRYIKIIIIIIIILIMIFKINIIKINDLELHFIDVGQGDSTLIITPGKKNILIDGGEGNSDKYDYGKNVLLPYLLDRRITKIDYLIISHADSDHIGGTFAILENLKVENILLGIQSESSKQLEDLLNIAQNKKIKINVLNAGDKLKIEKDIFIDVLWPSKNKIISENSLNNNSLVFKFNFKSVSALFTGDIEETAENEILKYYANNLNCLEADILKVAHHGSKTSSTEEFLKATNSQIALIGVGKNNNFGHPNDEVLERLENFKIKIFRTDEMGEIIIKINYKEKMNIILPFLHNRNRW